MTSRQKYFLIGLCLSFVLLGASGCELALPTPPPASYTVPEEQHPETAPGVVDITFQVKIPSNTPAENPILLSVLDEVTGLALNAKRHKMELIDESHYRVSLSLPVGTTLKYRYSRQGDILFEEHNSDGRAVRYRLYHVEAAGEVQDVITRWNDTPLDSPTGRISGSLSDAQSETPVAGILVSAGGDQVVTNSDGHFLLEGLPPGTHNLVAYAMDGSYTTFQQGALVAEGSNTPASIQLFPTKFVDVTFVLHVPEDTPPAVPLLLAGNLLQLGNTFADLSGGMNTLAARMPSLSPLPDGSYGLIISLPVGADVRYKYTLGDGFWNTERALDGAFVVRQLIVPDRSVTLEESVETWHAGGAAGITFDIIVPENTPADEGVYIQFHPYGWTEPLRMWHLGEQRWAYILYSPLDLIDQLGYRYCRAGQCGHADDERTPGAFTSGQIIETSPDPLGLPDEIELWRWIEDELPEVEVSDVPIPPRGADFMAGVEFQTFHQPSLIPFVPHALEKISQQGANWVVLTPSWTFTRSDPPILELVTGQDALWPEMTNMVEQALNRDLNVAIRPVPSFPTAVEAWWSSAARDFPFWVSWFDQYRAFALHHADLAERSGAQTLILGGAWMVPALPGGRLSDGTPTNVPQDAGQRYTELIDEIREHFSGTLAWALPYSEEITDPPDFLDAVDQIYVLWSAPLSDDDDADPETLQAEAERIINDKIFALRLVWDPDSDEKSIILSLAYPSVHASFSACLPDPFVECLSPEALNYPAPELPLLELDYVDQAKAYDAVLAAVNQVDWIDGVVSRGYYIPAILQDKSISIHGKPAENVLRYWFNQFLRAE
jgi:hypothetical protein